MKGVATRSACLWCGLVVTAVACFAVLPRPSELGPTRVSVRRSPREIVRTASQLLTAEHFVISASDSAVGTILATRVRSVEEQGGDIACSFAFGSPESKSATATMSLRISSTRAAGDSTLVIVTSDVRAVLVQQASADAPRKPNPRDCVSTGAVEQRIIAALR